MTTNAFLAISSILHWSKGEQNELFAQIFGRVAELNWMWEKALEDFSNQVIMHTVPNQYKFWQNLSLIEQQRIILL